MFVVQYGLSPDPARALGAVPAGSLGCLNTHDMPTFTAFWEGRDIDDRVALGLLDGRGSRQERERRREVKEALTAFLGRKGWLGGAGKGTGAVLAACLSYLAAGKAGVVIVNIEDLYLEREPQNVPGTSMEKPNWLRKARHGFEEVRGIPRVIRILREMDRLRSTGKARRGSPRGRGRKEEPLSEEVG